MTTPHASWAEFYDRAYEETFGSFYASLTDRTVQHVLDCLPSSSRVVDFGAGTGRIAIPLASGGLQVLAVEPCQEMLEQLTNKPGGEKVETVCKKIEDFDTPSPFDMAICVFTVLSYILDDEALEKSIRSMAKAIRIGGFLLIDIPTMVLFRSGSLESEHFYRTISIELKEDDIYVYKEKTKMHNNENINSYLDEFEIRFWKEEHVMSLMKMNGFIQEKDLSRDFTSTGSRVLSDEEG